MFDEEFRSAWGICGNKNDEEEKEKEVKVKVSKGKWCDRLKSTLLELNLSATGCMMADVLQIDPWRLHTI